MMRGRWPPQGLAGAQISSGTLGARPGAGVADRYYWATDVFMLFRDTGAAWEVVGGPSYGIYDWDLWAQSNAAMVVVANRRYYTPYQVKYTKTIDRLIGMFTVVSGNVRFALYEDNGYAPDGGDLVVQSASAAAIVNGKNEHVIADTQILPGLYWLAVQCSAADTMVENSAGRVSSGGTVFVRRVDEGYGVFSDPAPATVSLDGAPMLGVRIASIP